MATVLDTGAVEAVPDKPVVTRTSEAADGVVTRGITAARRDIRHTYVHICWEQHHTLLTALKNTKDRMQPIKRNTSPEQT